MEYITLEYIKTHSRIDYDCEDSLLELYGTAAEQTVAGFLNRGKKVSQMVASLTEDFGQVPATVMQATLMLTEQSYTQRGAVSPTAKYLVPYSIDILLKPYMVLTNNE